MKYITISPSSEYARQYQPSDPTPALSPKNATNIAPGNHDCTYDIPMYSGPNERPPTAYSSKSCDLTL